MKSFNEKYNDLRESCIEYITKFLKKNENKYFFIEGDIDWEKHFDGGYVLPEEVNNTNRHGDLQTYLVTKMWLEGEELCFSGYNLSDDDKITELFIEDVDLSFLTDCATLIQNK
jgi:hypothetical protein